MSLIVRDLLLAGHDYARLYEEHGIVAKPHNGKVSLNYDMLAARRDDPVAKQCRGVVVREHTWELLAYPFDRFFNHNEGFGDPIDWATACFEEKLDGTLIIAYHADDRWHCATRQMCEGHGNINGGVSTFSDLADAYARTLGVAATDFDTLMDGVGADIDTTYMFELTSPYNRVVCQYESIDMTLLGCRRRADLVEIDPAPEAEHLGFKTPKVWRFSSLEDMAEVMRGWHPAKYEGVVVKDAAFRRVKVKTPQYLAAHHATDSLGSSWRSVCAAVTSGVANDIEGMVPEFVQGRIKAVRSGLARVAEVVEADYAELRGIDDMKTYALAAKERLWPAALFSLKRGRVSTLGEFIADANPETIVELCNRVSPGLLEDKELRQ